MSRLTIKDGVCVCLYLLGPFEDCQRQGFTLLLLKEGPRCSVRLKQGFHHVLLMGQCVGGLRALAECWIRDDFVADNG